MHDEVEDDEEVAVVAQEEGVDGNINLSTPRITNPMQLFITHVHALIRKRLIYFKRDRRGLTCEIIIPCLVAFFGLALTLIQFINSSPEHLIEPRIYSTPISIIYSGIASEASMSQLTSNLHSEDWKAELFHTTSKHEWDSENYRRRSVSHKGSYFLTSIDNSS